MEFEAEVKAFLAEAERFGLRIIMVGGAAVNHHGYKRHSADVDLWIEPVAENFNRLLNVLHALEYELDDLPSTVRQAEQNVSIKISPGQEIELITRFNPGCSFEEAWSRCEITEVSGERVAKYRILGFDDLINSKIKSGRPRDLLDVYELQRRRENKFGS